MTNPLLELSPLPDFKRIQASDVAPAIQQRLNENRALIEQLGDPASPANWDGFMQVLSDAEERLGRAWSVVGHMHSVMDVPAWREAYNAMLPEVSGYYADLGQNLAIFAKVKALRQSDEFAGLSATRQRIVDNDIRDFRLSGAELADEVKPRFKAIQEELSALAAKFAENLLDATNAHAEFIDVEADLAGLPEDVKAAAKVAAASDPDAGDKTRWKFTLHAPSYLPVMQYAENRELRARMYRAYVTRAAEFGPAEWDNGPLINRILALRAEEARLLGYDNYAELSLVPKMASSSAEVAGFLRELAAKARPHAERDIAELRQFAREHLGLAELASWDLAWAAEKLKQARYAFSNDEVKQYFPEPQVMAGLFRVVSALFSVSIEPAEGPVWHPDVRLYRIARQGKTIGHFYVDLYARETKRGGAWMQDAISRRLTPQSLQTPLAYLCCNFPAPPADGSKPATFSHQDVLTLFHEAGHGLHHLLSEVTDLDASGLAGVEWDAVELPSQFMENFCWEWDVLSGMTRHVDTGEPLPRSLYDKMLAAKNFQSGMQMLRQIEFSLFDLLLHSEFDPQGQGSVQDLIAQVRREVAVVTPPDWNRFPQSFGHIFGGGYAAGYYSYKWAEVLSADAYAAFEEAAQAGGSTLDAETGQRFWREILAVGGSRPAMDSFKAFRGREPSVDALLRHNGMVSAPA